MFLELGLNNQTTLNWIQLISLIKIRSVDLEIDYDVIVHDSLFMNDLKWPLLTSQ